MPTDAPHLPVLWRETVDMVDPRPGQTVVDGTFGAGGHARLVAERLGPDGTLVVVDRDPVALAIAARFADEVPCHVRIVAAPFAEGLEALAAEGFRADGAYFDLGMSSMQIDQAERGFAYTRDAPLDMRMGSGHEADPVVAAPASSGASATQRPAAADRATSGTTAGAPDAPLSAADVVATWDVPSLTRALRDYGEERYALKIAKAIVREREKAPIDTTGRLVDVVTNAIPTPARHVGGHPAKRTFQALRIVVNDELGQIDRALPAAWSLLGVGGRLAVISFHSLEDRRVKRFVSSLLQGCVCPPDLPVCACGQEPEATVLGKGGVVPTPEEQEQNPRSRSARLRGALRTAVPA
ncbi:16S rRNA (cytosine(1402)-N(4))-methyltransferase RsmH [Patulibacter minatonensis]|uniref:16S rRNA (cytosine(1402)-N(4))-methyltransferase RsmH n=1 Tax=Patulibacter minatonensis TaxID=298163 RepID=UPI00047EFD61|nr:16S rRNA (cytosine(1402)-N(4))-methyltransferase RsmH [Patulibacter minatonensis]